MQFPVRIYYEDTDAGGVVYHAQYLNFFERARTEALRTLGFSQAILLKQQLAFVVKKVEIDYRLPACLDDALVVDTQLINMKKASMVFCQRLYRGENCLAEAVVTVACVELTNMKPKAIPQSIYQALAMINAS